MIKSTNLEKEWADVKAKLAIGTVVKGEVFGHWPFGVVVKLKGPFVGLIEIPYFKEEGQRMTPKEYPDLGKPIRAVVKSFSELDHQVKLSARPSDLAKAGK